jgi:hypothetical protein
MSNEILGRANGKYFTKDYAKLSFCNHNPLDTRFVTITDSIHKGDSALNPRLTQVVEDDLLYGFAIACPI